MEMTQQNAMHPNHPNLSVYARQGARMTLSERSPHKDHPSPVGARAH